MSFLKNTISLVALFSVIPAAYAATPRASVSMTAARRMPTMTIHTGSSTTTTTTTSSALLDNIECIDAYTECITADDACGSDFEECTTNVLFHGQMPKCISTLAQCSSAGVSSLFGTSTISALSTVANKNNDGEVTRYTYPTDGSVLGQRITAAAITNRYDTSTCVKRYSSCLKKDSVCGEDFELCTSDREFKKQAIFCDSTLARCAADGVKELFGQSSWTPSSASIGNGRIRTMIDDGAQLAAVNAVSTCYKVIDQCFLGACTANPFRCIEGTTLSKLTAANQVAGETSAGQSSATDALSKSDVNKYLRTSCQDTIGANKYCYMTFMESTPSKKDLQDVEMQEEVFSAALDQRKQYVDSKIQDLMEDFDAKAKGKCVDTIKSCAMRSCGGGSGAACYSLVFSANGQNTINGASSYGDIKTACESVVNTDPNCLYAKAAVDNQAYSYSFTDGGAFSTLFPEYDSTVSSDPIGAVAALNSSLSTSYNDAAIAQMKRQCQSVATSCVKSMCGADYVNCYRNRTDIYSSLTNTGEATFDKSMNKVGGVLDYTIVLGLCLDTVKNASVCEEHLAIERARYTQADGTTNGWGDATSAREGWIDAGSATAIKGEDAIQATDENGNSLCTSKTGAQGICYSVDAAGNVYDTPVVIGYSTYVESQAASSLFKDLVYDIEKEAQAKYNAKLTKQQNMCLSSNNGGILGSGDTGSTFMWAKLKSNKVPNNYATAGLKPSQFAASNDLYGSFCRVRVTLQSDDTYIQDAMVKGTDWSTAYFAAGDAFTCGSWIPNDKLQELAQAAGADARDAAQAGQPKNLEWWMTAVGALGGGLGGAYLGAGIQKGEVFGGLMGKKADDVKKTSNWTAENCQQYADNYNIGDSDVIARTMLNNMRTANEGADSVAMATARKFVEYSTKDSFTDAQAKEVCGAELTGCKIGGTGADKDNHSDSLVKSKALEKAKTEINKLVPECKALADNQSADEEEKKGLSTGAAAGIGAAVTSIAGGALGYTVTKAALNAQLDKAEQEAIKEFMDNVGSKIRCYIGADEVGTYGDIISTSME